MMWYWMMFVLILAFASILFIRLTMVVVTVENYSMSPTLVEGDRVLLFRYWPKRWIKKGHIVVVWPWERYSWRSGTANEEVPFIKRVIGMPQETLITLISELDSINRELQAEAHDQFGRRSWYIPPDYCFVRGDHPIGGFDSLSWGPIPLRHILGVVIAKLPKKGIVFPSTNNYDTEGPMIGQAAPDFKAKTLHGKQVVLDYYANKITIIIFTSKSSINDALNKVETASACFSLSRVQFVLVIIDLQFGDNINISDNKLLYNTVVLQGDNSCLDNYKFSSWPCFCTISNGIVQSKGLFFPTDQTWQNSIRDCSET